MSLLAHMHEVIQLKDNLYDCQQENEWLHKPFGIAIISDCEEGNHGQEDHQDKCDNLSLHIFSMFFASIFQGFFTKMSMRMIFHLLSPHYSH